MEFTNKTDILIFFANAIDSKGDDGSQIKGCSVHFMFWEGVRAGVSEPDVNKPVGMQRGKSWMDYDMRNKIRIAPAIYEGTFRMSVNSDGKTTLNLIDVAYKYNVKIEPFVLPGLVVPGMIENVDLPADNKDNAADNKVKK